MCVGTEVLPKMPTGVVWKRGDVVEVAWTIEANHGGGYQYVKTDTAHSDISKRSIRAAQNLIAMDCIVCDLLLECTCRYRLAPADGPLNEDTFGECANPCKHQRQRHSTLYVTCSIFVIHTGTILT